MQAAVSRKRESRAFDFRDPPLSDRGRTDHRQLEMNENTWDKTVHVREEETAKVRSLSTFLF